MKKGFTYLFLLVFIWSQFGFLINRFNQMRLDRIMESKIESHDYKDEYLLELKIPLHLPYYLDQPDYKSSKGEINYQGHIYNYVKSRVKSDTLYILCLRNDIKTEWVHLSSSILKINHPASIKNNTHFSSFSFIPLFFPPSLWGLQKPLAQNQASIFIPHIKILKPFLGTDFIPPDYSHPKIS